MHVSLDSCMTQQNLHCWSVYVLVSQFVGCCHFNSRRMLHCSFTFSASVPLSTPASPYPSIHPSLNMGAWMTLTITPLWIGSALESPSCVLSPLANAASVLTSTPLAALPAALGSLDSVSTSTSSIPGRKDKVGLGYFNFTGMADLSDTSRWWFNSVWVCVRRHVAILLSAWWMADYETLHVCRVPWCQQCVKFWWWPSDPIKLKKCFTNLICHFVFQNMRSAGYNEKTIGT